jgi:hypothetical protein
VIVKQFLSIRLVQLITAILVGGFVAVVLTNGFARIDASEPQSSATSIASPLELMVDTLPGSTFTSLGSNVAINDVGTIAFTAIQISSKNQIFVIDSPQSPEGIGIPLSRMSLVGIGITNPLAGMSTEYAVALEVHHGHPGSEHHRGDASHYNIKVFGTDGTIKLIGTSDTSDTVSRADFTDATSGDDINDNGVATFVASGDTVFAGSSRPPSPIAAYSQGTLRPQIANTDDIVVRDPDGNIEDLSYEGTHPEVRIATIWLPTPILIPTTVVSWSSLLLT